MASNDAAPTSRPAPSGNATADTLDFGWVDTLRNSMNGTLPGMGAELVPEQLREATITLCNAYDRLRDGLHPLPATRGMGEGVWVPEHAPGQWSVAKLWDYYQHGGGSAGPYDYAALMERLAAPITINLFSQPTVKVSEYDREAYAKDAYALVCHLREFETFMGRTAEGKSLEAAALAAHAAALRQQEAMRRMLENPPNPFCPACKSYMLTNHPEQKECLWYCANCKKLWSVAECQAAANCRALGFAMDRQEAGAALLAEITYLWELIDDAPARQPEDELDGDPLRRALDDWCHQHLGRYRTLTGTVDEALTAYLAATPRAVESQQPAAAPEDAIALLREVLELEALDEALDNSMEAVKEGSKYRAERLASLLMRITCCVEGVPLKPATPGSAGSVGEWRWVKVINVEKPPSFYDLNDDAGEGAAS